LDVDFDTEQRLIGFELLSASKRYSHPISSTCPPKTWSWVVVRGGEPFYPLRFESA